MVVDDAVEVVLVGVAPRGPGVERTDVDLGGGERLGQHALPDVAEGGGGIPGRHGLGGPAGPEAGSLMRRGRIQELVRIVGPKQALDLYADAGERARYLIGEPQAQRQRGQAAGAGEQGGVDG